MPFELAKSANVLAGQKGRVRNWGRGSYTGKRALDLALVVMTFPLLMAVVAMMASVVALDGANPFFLQRRIGRNGRSFRMIKLRTMVPEAENRLQTYLKSDPAARLEWEQFQKLTRDPRVTWIGSILRRTSLDELPQFLNVLFGDMSLVGPRPILPAQTEIYPGSAYYRMRPGVTGPWQVSERNEVSFADRAKYDLNYLETQSVFGDLRYLALTILAVCRLSGR
ncbi:sugar transferase [Tropicimonas sp. TH_r6]|uniref:sugar transferase n=1 Tax=Tropicimonas sp. TH_r6 TaxID=3082085 RepID=UPI00295496AE|nr:sugar transferase [Tropicimonas sp. TH_r6]MDV7142213.1 sugar transferase [Tropicimonas sp. TH_r6]